MARLGRSSPGAPKLPLALGPIDEFQEPRRKRRSVGIADQVALHPITNELRNASYGGRDDGPADCHRFEQRVR